MRNLVKIFLLLLILNPLNCLSQDNSWKGYNFNDICSFKLPPSLEMRNNESLTSGVLTSSVNKMTNIFIPEYTSVSQIKFQPKGINSNQIDSVRNALSLYARVIVSCENNDEVTQDDVKKMSKEELNQLSAIWKKEILSQMNMVNFGKDFVWYPVRREMIDGKYAIVKSYERGGKKGKVYVKQYMFAIDKYLVEFTISYRDSEKELWKSDFDKIKDTIKFK